MTTTATRRPIARSMHASPWLPGHDRAAGRRVARKLLALVLGGLVPLVALATPAGARRPGDLDTSFSEDGIVVAPAALGATASSTSDSEGHAVAVPLVPASGEPAVAVLGHNPRGDRLGFAVSSVGSPQASFDGTFVPPNDDGLAINDRGPEDPGTAYHDAVAVRSCPRFICINHFTVAGTQSKGGPVVPHGKDKFAVFAIGPSTGTDVVLFNSFIEESPAEAFGIALRSDGDYIAVGVRHSTPKRVALVRVNPNGTVDTSFGGGDGIISHQISGGDAMAYEVALQRDGKIVVVGAVLPLEATTSWPYVGRLAFVARFLADGSLDTGFGAGGTVTWSATTGHDVVAATGVKIASDGDIVVSGKQGRRCSGDTLCETGRSGFVRRLTSAGVPDTTFGSGGLVVSPGEFEDVVLDRGGRITAVGTLFNDTTPLSSIALLVRYTATGILDSAFGVGGIAVFKSTPGFSGLRVMSAEMSADSRHIIVGGTMFSATPDDDRMFLARVLAETSCGNATIEPGEDCDLGDGANGTSGLCCTTQCTFTTAGTQCRAGAGDPNGSGFVCNPAETCTGSSATCPSDVIRAGVTCRTGSGDFCDAAEVCPTGTGSVCGADIRQIAGTTCRAGSGDTCDPAETCTGAARATCPADVRKAAGTTCRVGSGDTCDPAETCTGVALAACPADLVTAAGTTCRAGSGDQCDPTETCTGVALAACPVDLVTAAGTTCRARADTTCDVAENCTGTAGQACPADAGAPEATVCRAAVDVCDFTETCGGATTCPANQQKPDLDGDTLCDQIDNCDLVANPDQSDPDNDDVGTACDNCPNACNPDQDNSDGDAGGGDVCDICPAIDEAAEPAECATAEYNSALACCRDSASEGVSVDADGAACGAAGAVSFQTPPDPTTGTTVTIEIPAGAVDEPTSISVTPMTKGGSDHILSTGTGNFVTGALMEPAGAIFDPPLLVCMAWQDADNRPGRVDNLDFVVEEVNIRPTLRDETTGTEVVLGPRCGLQASCGALGPNGLPATVPGTLNDPTLAACCSVVANVYCFEVSHFSAYALADLSCAGEATARIIATRMDNPAGTQGLKIKGEFDLGGPIAGGLEPATSGFELVILSASETPLYQVTLPAGAYSRETGEGWQTSPRGGKAQWKSKTGIAGIDKVKLEWDDASGEGGFDLTGKDLSLAVTAADLPLQAEVRLDPSALAGRCGLATWTPPSGICAFNGSASTLLCQ